MRYTLRRCWHLLAEVIVVIAILVTVLRFALPHLNDYRHNLEEEFGRSSGQLVSIGHLAASWHGMGPLLTLSQVRVYARDHTSDLVRAEEVRIGLNLWQSILDASLAFDRIELLKAKLTLTREVDGRIGLEGLSDNGEANTADNTAADNEFIRWVFEQGTISIRQSDIQWLNKARPGHPQLVRHVNLELYNEGRRHQVEGDIRLNSESFPDVRFSMDLLGDLTSPDWSGQGYMETLGVNLTPWLSGHDLSGFELISGKVGMRLWMSWQSGRLQDTRGRFVAADLHIRGRKPLGEVEGIAAPELSWSRLAGSILWQRRPQGWRLALPDVQIDDAPERAELTVTATNNEASTEFDAHADRLSIKGLLDVYRLSGVAPPAMEPSLQEAAINGRLDTVHLRYLQGDVPKFAIKGSFAAVSSEGSANLPGFGHLNGEFVADQEAGAVRFELKDTALKLSSLFRDPIPLERLSGGLDWRRDRQGLALAVNGLELKNEDLDIQGGMGALLPKDGNPNLYIRLDARSSGGVAHTSRYLPASIMAQDAVDWLDRSLIGGDVEHATVIVDGPLDRFPFDHGGGRFSVQAKLKNGELEFAPGWPRIHGIDADLEFVGQGLKIAGHRGESLGLAVHDVSIDITDLYGDHPNLVLTGKANGTTRQALDYVVNSPVNGVLGSFASGAQAEGGSDLDLSLDVPLMNSLDTKVKGRLQFHDSTLNLVDAGLAIEGIRGALDFTEADVRARGVQARILGLNSRIDISRRSLAKGRRVTRFQAAGRIDDRQIDAILGGIPDGMVAGKTDWRATLDLFGAKDSSAEDPLLKIMSDLKGMAVNVPEPLAKTAPSSRAFALEMRLPQRVGRAAVVRYGASLSGLLDLDGKMRVQRATLHWGKKGRPRLVKAAGIRLTGHLASLDLGPWLELVDRPDLRKGAISPGSQLTGIDVTIDDFSLSGHHFPNAGITGKRQPSAWHFVVKGPELAGRIESPVPFGGRPLKVNLDHLIIPAEAAEGDEGQSEGSRVSPRQIPALEVTSKSLVFSGMQLGSLTLSTVPRPDGMDIRALVLERPEARFDIHGTWTEKDGKQVSDFATHFSSQDLGGTLQGLGFPELISKGHGESSATLHWPGSPADFTWSAMGGHMNVLFQEGRILEIEPGAGRIIGLFSLQTLPRRLFMDFSDVLRRGYAFDRIEGDLDIEAGVARTQNLYLDGPSARIEIKGATDLAARQYDQDIIVNPHVGAGLPVAGALAGGLGVGAAVLIFERIFQHDLAKIARTHYRVTGPWSAPTTVTVREQSQLKK